MLDEHADKPDITLTLDHEGVIRNVALSDALEDETLESWRGRPWDKTVSPDLAERVSQAMPASNSRRASAFASFLNRLTCQRPRRR